MKINRKRSAISQSMDLFIIVAAVLGVGGIVTASVYNLVNSATANASVSVVSASVRAGQDALHSPTAISISIKNNGGSPINCTNKTCQIAFTGTDTGLSTAPSCVAPCSITYGGPATWTVGGPNGHPTAGYPLTFETNNFTLSAGAQTSFVLNGPLSTGTTPTFWTTGSSVTVNVLFGSAAVQVAVTSQ
jgi:hypothetical protein